MIHKIVPILKEKNQSNQEKEAIFSEYSKERREIGLKNSNTAMKYYKTSIEIPRLLGFSYFFFFILTLIQGLDMKNLQSLKRIVENIPFLSKNTLSSIFNWSLKLGSYPIEIRFLLNLFKK